MKTHRLGESSVEARFRRRASENPPKSPRECLLLGDPTDCLLDAYDCVAQRAYENFLAHGPRPGGELEDWLAAERQLLLSFPIDLHETDKFIYALASVPCATASHVSIGIESRWMVILVRQPATTSQAREHSRPAVLEQQGNARPRAEFKPEQPHSADPLLEERRAKSVCVLGLPGAVDPTRSIAVLADGVLGIRMAKVHPGT